MVAGFAVDEKQPKTKNTKKPVSFHQLKVTKYIIGFNLYLVHLAFYLHL